MTQSKRASDAGDLDRWVTWLDDAFCIPGTNIRIGLDAIVGFLAPGAGDVLTGLASVAVLIAAVRRGVPRVILLRMIVNIAIDVAIGWVPIVGDVADVMWRSNRKNLDLLERHEDPDRPATAGDWAVVLGAIAAILTAVAIPLAITGGLIAWLWKAGG